MSELSQNYSSSQKYLDVMLGNRELLLAHSSHQIKSIINHKAHKLQKIQKKKKVIQLFE